MGLYGFMRKGYGRRMPVGDCLNLDLPDLRIGRIVVGEFFLPETLILDPFVKSYWRECQPRIVLAR